MYYDFENKVFIPDDKLAELGLPEGREELAGLGFYPVECRLPEIYDSLTGKLLQQTYDPEIQGVEPDGEPEFSESEPGLLIQKMRVINFLEDFRQAKLQELAARRWERQCAGFTLADGTLIQTSPDDFSRLVVTAQSCQTESVTLKSATGWIVFKRERFLEAIQLAGAYIEACYEHERRLSAAIGIASGIEMLNSIVIDQGWPEPAEKQAEV